VGLQTGSMTVRHPIATETAGEMQKGDAMKTGEMGGNSGNTGVPGAPPAAEGNKN